MGFAAIAGIAVFLAFVLSSAIALMLMALIYVALRIRDNRDSNTDPQLGKKAAFHLVHTMSVLMVLGGLTTFMVDALSGTIAGKQRGGGAGGGAAFGPPMRRGGGFNEAQRTGVALVVVGTVFGLIFWGLLLATNDSERNNVRRVYVGGRMALALLITLFSFSLLVINLFQQTSSDELTETAIALMIVWIPAAGIHLALFQANASEGRSSGAGAAPRWSDD
jgi:heme/copper-type cytochrome/quinol oxidase subunit 2